MERGGERERGGGGRKLERETEDWEEGERKRETIVLLAC